MTLEEWAAFQREEQGEESEERARSLFEGYHHELREQQLRRDGAARDSTGAVLGGALARIGAPEPSSEEKAETRAACQRARLFLF